MVLIIAVFILVLSVLVFAHELGHFWTAKKFGVRAEEFGFGFPPRMFGIQVWREEKLKKVLQEEEILIKTEEIPLPDNTEFESRTIIDRIREIDIPIKTLKWRFIKGSREITETDAQFGTVYSINWLPLGGFVKIKGENGENETDQDSFSSRPIWQRGIMLSAGVTMNLFLAMILITIGLMVGMPQVVDDISPKAKIEDKKIQIVEIFENSPAKNAGLQVGDVIKKVDGMDFVDTAQLQNYVDSRSGQELTYGVISAGQEKEIKIIPEIRQDTGKGGVGIAITQTGIVKYPWYLAIWEGFKTTFYLFWAILVAFYQLFRDLILGHGINSALSGPVGIAAITGQVARMGFIYILQFTALLSINLAILNFLPFPALDGGRFLFLIVEKLKGKPVKRELEAALHNIGFILLLLLVVVITFRDITRYSDKFRFFWEKIIG